jgi:hypothetical protein
LQTLAPIGELGSEQRVPDLLALPGSEIGVLHPQRLEHRRLAFLECHVQVGELAGKDAGRPLVAHRVVHVQQKGVIGIAEAKEHEAVQRRATQIEGPPRFGTTQASGFRRPLCLGQMTKIHFVQLVFTGRCDELHRFAIADEEASPERFVPLHDHCKRRGERTRVERPANAQREGHVVRRALWLELLDQPHTPLRKRRGKGPVARQNADGAQLDRRPRQAALRGALGKRRDGRSLEQSAQRQLHLKRVPYP